MTPPDRRYVVPLWGIVAYLLLWALAVGSILMDLLRTP